MVQRAPPADIMHKINEKGALPYKVATGACVGGFRIFRASTTHKSCATLLRIAQYISGPKW